MISFDNRQNSKHQIMNSLSVYRQNSKHLLTNSLRVSFTEAFFQNRTMYDDKLPQIYFPMGPYHRQQVDQGTEAGDECVRTSDIQGVLSCLNQLCASFWNQFHCLNVPRDTIPLVLEEGGPFETPTTVINMTNSG